MLAACVYDSVHYLNGMITLQPVYRLHSPTDTNDIRIVFSLTDPFLSLAALIHCSARLEERHSAACAHHVNRGNESSIENKALLTAFQLSHIPAVTAQYKIAVGV